MGINPTQMNHEDQSVGHAGPETAFENLSSDFLIEIAEACPLGSKRSPSHFHVNVSICWEVSSF